MESIRQFIVVDNVGKANPHDFSVDLETPIRDVTRIELVSASAEVRDMVATLSVSFGPLENTFVWPLFADRNYDSPLSVHPKNRYYATFDNPVMPRLDRVSIKVEGLLSGTTTLTDANEQQAVYEANARLSLVFLVHSRAKVDRGLPGITMGRPEVQRDYFIVDNRDARGQAFEFAPKNDRSFRNVLRVSLKEAVLSRRVTSEPYVIARALGRAFPLFFRYDTFGMYYPYELLKSTDYNTIEYDPPLATLASPEVSLVNPDANTALSDIDPIVIMLFEVEYVPRIEDNPSKVAPQATQKTYLLVDNRAQDTRYSFTHPLDTPLKNVRSLKLKHLTFPGRGWTARPYFMTLELSGLGISWDVPYDVYYTDQGPNAMVVLPNVHSHTYDNPVNISQLSVVFRGADGEVYQGAPEDLPAVFVLEAIYDPRT